MVGTKTTKTPISAVTSEQTSKSPKVTASDKSSGNETFYSFVMNNIKELNDNANLKHDLSKDLDGVVLMCRELTSEELVSRTGKAFKSSLVGDKTGQKIYEYFVYVPEISDYGLSPFIEDLVAFYKLRHAEKQLQEAETNKNKAVDNIDLDIILSLIPKQEDRRGIINMVQTELESFFRFYGTEQKTGSNLVLCKVRFHDPNSLQFGKFISVKSELDTMVPLPLEILVDQLNTKYQNQKGTSKPTGYAKKKKDKDLKNNFVSDSDSDASDLLSALDQADAGDIDAYADAELARIIGE